MSNSETTAAIQRGATAAERAIMGYTRPDGTYVQGAVNFWDDSVESGELIASDVLTAALAVEELARFMHSRSFAKEAPWDALTPGMKDGFCDDARALRAAILGGAS